MTNPGAQQGRKGHRDDLPHLIYLPLPHPDGGELQAHQGRVVLPLAQEKLLPHLLERPFGLSELAEAGENLALDTSELQKAEGLSRECLSETAAQEQSPSFLELAAVRQSMDKTLSTGCLELRIRCGVNELQSLIQNKDRFSWITGVMW